MLFATDLDGTLALGQKEELTEIYDLLDSTNATVVYVTGRDIRNFKKLRKNFYKEKGIHLYPPDFLVTHNGIRVYKYKKNRLVPFKNLWTVRQWHKQIKKGWNKKLCYEAFYETSKKIRFGNDYPSVIDVRYRPSPYHLEVIVNNEDIDKAKEIFTEECEKRDLKVNLIFDYLEKRYVDMGIKVLDTIDKTKAKIVREMRDETEGIYVIMPSATTKGEAVQYLRNISGYKQYQVVAAGDGGNDYHLLTQGFKSIVVNNAHPILLKKPLKEVSDNLKENVLFVDDDGAAGVLAGLKYYLDESFPHSSDSCLGSVINA